jgi:hypothetical protein
MKVYSKRLAVLAITATVSVNANAGLWEFMASLSGANEVPPNASPATGMAMGTYDDVTNMFMMDTTASGFVANVTAAHIHLGAVGVAGPIVFPLSGTVGSTSYTSHDMFMFTEANEGDFLAGNYYVNVHSAQFPAGEIRGQLVPTQVPEPSTLGALMLVGGLMLGLRRRK